MALTAVQKRKAATRIANTIYEGLTSKIATTNLEDLISAIGNHDDAMDTIISNFPAGWQSKTLKQALLDNVSGTAGRELTSKEKGLALAIWALEETGYLDTSRVL